MHPLSKRTENIDFLPNPAVEKVLRLENMRLKESLSINIEGYSWTIIRQELQKR